MPEIAILEVFADLSDRRRKQGKRHSIPLCLALFTLAVAAGNQGFLARSATPRAASGAETG